MVAVQPSRRQAIQHSAQEAEAGRLGRAKHCTEKTLGRPESKPAQPSAPKVRALISINILLNIKNHELF